MRFWVLNDDMLLEDFIDSYNKSIADDLTHTFEFPGQSLEKMVNDQHYIDE